MDHIWTNISDHAVKSEIISRPTSDHLPVLACTNIESKQKQSRENLTKARQFTSRNFARFNTELQNIGIEPVLNEASPNKALNLLITELIAYYQGCHTVLISKICPFLEGACLRKLHCTYF